MPTPQSVPFFFFLKREATILGSTINIITAMYIVNSRKEESRVPKVGELCLQYVMVVPFLP